jgi:hypothetical protein
LRAVLEDDTGTGTSFGAGVGKEIGNPGRFIGTAFGSVFGSSRRLSLADGFDSVFGIESGVVPISGVQATVGNNFVIKAGSAMRAGIGACVGIATGALELTRA